MYTTTNETMPDFFIVGAPKAGTSALDAYLRQHPDIFMCRKEAHYFCTDFPENVNFGTFTEYQTLFEGAGEGQAVGEASVWYLYSRASVPKILSLNPNAKFLAMLRDPVKAAQATHGELLLDLREDEPNFEKAWRLQEARRKGQRLPLNAREPRHLLYKDVCSWSSQVERLLVTVPTGSVKIIVMEEFFADPDQGYRDVLDFIGAKDISLKSYPKINESRRVKNLTLLKASNELPNRFPTIFSIAKRMVNAFGLHPGQTLYQYTRSANAPQKARPALSAAFHQELIEEFRPDVERLENILGRSLKDIWLKDEAAD